MLNRLILVSVMVLSLGACRNDKAIDEAIDASTNVSVEETIESSDDTSEEDMPDDFNDLEDTDTVVEDTQEEN